MGRNLPQDLNLVVMDCFSLTKMTTEKVPNPNPIEQFVLLAKSAKGAAAAELIKQALDTPGVYVFRELIDMPNVKELVGTSYNNVWELLNVFAYGTYKDYLAAQNDLPELSVNQKKKLQHLTIVSLSEQGKCIPYNKLLVELRVANLRELEDLIIEAIYAEIIQGKLDQNQALLEIDTTIGRDIRPENTDAIKNTLESWCETCETVLSTLQAQVHRANLEKTSRIQRKEQQDQEISTLKKTVKAHSQQDQDELMTESREAKGVEKTPKKSTRSGIRTGGKFFNK
ncbi:unnamed protein product [Allacma fusca]|uniref:PCI domain-containing protein n=1 Tax=Allacma fusca TaxID=39272 RepID=A0A8J2P8N5_9HEXA|nr:unnamed protein product [Allacma fusca]